MNTLDRRTPAQIVRECRELVLQYFNGDVAKVNMWFALPNPMLRGYRPDTLIKTKRHCQLLRAIKSSMEKK